MKGAIFDWDGTLVEIDEREYYCINTALRKHGEASVSHDFFVKNYYQRAFEVGTGPRMVLETALSRNRSRFEKVYSTYRSLFAETVDRAVLQKGTLELLGLLRQKRYRVGVATMRFTRATVRLELEGLGLNSLVEVLLTREDLGFSRKLGSLEETVAQRVQLVSTALERLNSAPYKSFLVGDSWWDIRAGKRLGMKTVLILTGFARHNDFSNEKPDYTARSIGDLAGLVQNGQFLNTN